MAQNAGNPSSCVLTIKGTFTQCSFLAHQNRHLDNYHCFTMWQLSMWFLQVKNGKIKVSPVKIT